MHAINFYRQSVLCTALLLKMLFKWQAFATFVATSELSIVAASELPQGFFLHVFSHFQTIAPTLPKLQ